jgi:hypothetical protein
MFKKILFWLLIFSSGLLAQTQVDYRIDLRAYLYSTCATGTDSSFQAHLVATARLEYYEINNNVKFYKFYVMEGGDMEFDNVNLYSGTWIFTLVTDPGLPSSCQAVYSKNVLSNRLETEKQSISATQNKKKAILTFLN